MNIKQITKKVSKTIVFSSIIVALTVIPIVISAAYSFLQADDFSHAKEVGVFGGNVVELFIASLRYDQEMFETWQGTYTAMFLQAFLSPLNGLGLKQLQIVMVANALLFVISLAVLVISVCRCCHIDREKTVILFTVCIVGIFGFDAWTEIFNWFSGAVSYSFPLSFCFLGIGVMLMAKSRWGYLAAVILVFLASGGSLVVGGAGCTALLTICIAKKLLGVATKKDYVILGAAVIGALINALAPGNYIRHAVIDSSGIHFGNALVLSVLEAVDIIEKLLYDTPFILLLFIALVIGVSMGKRQLVNRHCLYAIIFFNVAILIATCFPICLGYSGREWIPNRGKFVETVIAVIVTTVITMAIGCLISEKIKWSCGKEICFTIAILLVVMPNINSTWRISALIPYKMWEQVANHSYKSYYDAVNNIYNMIKTDRNEDVFVHDLPGEGIICFPTMDLSEDMSWWVNCGIAEYYGKRSVQYVSSNVYDYGNGEKNIRIYPEMFEAGSKYVSIYKTNSITQEVETIQELKPFDSNLIISTHNGENGEINIYAYEDELGTIQIGEYRIEY